MLGHEERELSSLVKWSQASGAMWLHMLLSAGFNDHRSFPFTKFHQHVGPSEWAKREREFDQPEVLEAFASRKINELDNYDEALEQMEEKKALLDSGKITKEGFVATALMEPWYFPSSASNNEMTNDNGLFHTVATWFTSQAAKLRGATWIG